MPIAAQNNEKRQLIAYDELYDLKNSVQPGNTSYSARCNFASQLRQEWLASLDPGRITLGIRLAGYRRGPLQMGR